MKIIYTFTILLAVFYSVVANSHLPEDPGFVPPVSPMSDAAAAFLLAQATTDIPLTLPTLAAESNVDPAVSNSNNPELGRQMFAQINQLCAILKNCNPLAVQNAIASVPSPFNSVPSANSFPAPPPTMPATGFAATPAPPSPPPMGYTVPTFYGAIPTPAPMGYVTVPTTVRYPVSGQTSYNAPTLTSQMFYPTTTYRPVVLGNYYLPAPPAAVTPSNSNILNNATAAAMTMRPLMQSYGAPATMAYQVTTMRPLAPISFSAPSPPMNPPRPYPIAVSSSY